MTTYRVDYIESERGWGQRLDEVQYFTGPNSREEAYDAMNKFNSHNTGKLIPDWYMYASNPVEVSDQERINYENEIREQQEQKIVNKLKGIR